MPTSIYKPLNSFAPKLNLEMMRGADFMLSGDICALHDAAVTRRYEATCGFSAFTELHRLHLAVQLSTVRKWANPESTVCCCEGGGAAQHSQMWLCGSRSDLVGCREPGVQKGNPGKEQCSSSMTSRRGCKWATPAQCAAHTAATRSRKDALSCVAVKSLRECRATGSILGEGGERAVVAQYQMRGWWTGREARV